MIQSCGADVHIMGSRKTGSMAANEPEGWRGFKLDEIEKKAMQSVTNIKPNIFTVNAGSNDCIQSLEIDSFGKRMGNLIDFLWLECPESTVILSTLLLNTDQQTNSRILRVKDQIRALVEEKATTSRFVIVDMHTDKGPRSEDFVDGTHPGDLGYRKVAEIWLDGIQDASLKNFFETANSYY
jgi:lysophospholipase L1-like esterase